MKLSCTETGHQGLILIVNFSLSLSLLLLLLYSQVHLLNTRLVGNFQLVSHLSVFGWDNRNLRTAYYVDLTDVTFSSPE